MDSFNKNAQSYFVKSANAALRLSVFIGLSLLYASTNISFALPPTGGFLILNEKEAYKKNAINGLRTQIAGRPFGVKVAPVSTAGDLVTDSVNKGDLELSIIDTLDSVNNFKSCSTFTGIPLDLIGGDDSQKNVVALPLPAFDFNATNTTQMVNIQQAASSNLTLPRRAIFRIWDKRSGGTVACSNNFKAGSKPYAEFFMFRPATLKVIEYTDATRQWCFDDAANGNNPTAQRVFVKDGTTIPSLCRAGVKFSARVIATDFTDNKDRSEQISSIFFNEASYAKSKPQPNTNEGASNSAHLVRIQNASTAADWENQPAGSTGLGSVTTSNTDTLLAKGEPYITVPLYYNDVGYFRFTTGALDNASWTSTDFISSNNDLRNTDRGNGRCTPNSASNNTDATTGRVGCFVATNITQSIYMGRFLPLYRTIFTQGNHPYLTYTGQEFGFSLKAVNTNGQTLKNYRGTYARDVSIASYAQNNVRDKDTLRHGGDTGQHFSIITESDAGYERFGKLDTSDNTKYPTSFKASDWVDGEITGKTQRYIVDRSFADATGFAPRPIFFGVNDGELEGQPTGYGGKPIVGPDSFLGNDNLAWGWDGKWTGPTGEYLALRQGRVIMQDVTSSSLIEINMPFEVQTSTYSHVSAFELSMYRDSYSHTGQPLKWISSPWDMTGDITVVSGIQNAVQLALINPKPAVGDVFATTHTASALSCVEDTENPGRSGAGCVTPYADPKIFRKGAAPAGGAYIYSKDDGSSFNLWLAKPATEGTLWVKAKIPAWLPFIHMPQKNTFDPVWATEGIAFAKATWGKPPRKAPYIYRREVF